MFEGFVPGLKGNALFHIPERFERAVIKVAPVHERIQVFEKPLSLVYVPGRSPRLDHGVPFPFTALGLVVMLETGAVHDNRSGGPERTQPCVHPEKIGSLGTGIKKFQETSGKFCEKLFVFHRPVPVRGAVSAVHEDQIDIRGEVEFFRTEFAHAEDDQLLFSSLFVRRNAVDRAELFVKEPLHGVDAGVGKFGKIAQGFLQKRLSAKIPPGDPDHFIDSAFQKRLLELRLSHVV